jgi:DNA-binding IclR family transcriptional regulator
MNRISSPKDYKVHSLERGLDLIELLAEGSPEKSLTALSQEAGFNLTTTHRILDALKSRGYVQQDPKTSEYKLSLKLFELGNKVIRHVKLREEALPVLKSLADKTGETAYLIIKDADEALCLERIDGHHYVKVLFLQIGGRMPLHIGAGPRVLFAHLPEEEIDRIVKREGLSRWTPRSITDPVRLEEDLREIREQGYALSFEDVTEGAAALGCPVRDWKGDVVAAISISGVSSHFTEDKVSHIVEFVKEAADSLSRKLGAS